MKNVENLETISSVSDISLDTTSMSLVVTTEVITLSETNSPITNKRTKQDVYQLRPVTAQELLELRLSMKPGLVYKQEDSLFYTDIPDDLSISGKGNFKHMCNKDCVEVGFNCPRTRDLTTSFQMRIGQPFVRAVKKSWRIEKYPFIKEGIESFNMKNSYDAFIVIECIHYQKR